MPPRGTNVLAELLPGTWQLGATNLPHFLTGERSSVTFSYELVTKDPLVVVEEQGYTGTDGKRRRLHRVSKWQQSQFQSRGSRLHRVKACTWTVAGADQSGSIVALRYSKSRGIPEGLLLMTRRGADVRELRTVVATRFEEFGLSAEDFGSLSWFDASRR